MRLEAGEGVLRRGEPPVVPLVSVTRMVKICSCNLYRGSEAWTRQPRGMDQALDTTRGLGDALALRRRFTDGTGDRDSSQPISGTIKDAPSIQTPFRAEHGPGGHVLFGKGTIKGIVTKWSLCRASALSLGIGFSVSWEFSPSGISVQRVFLFLTNGCQRAGTGASFTYGVCFLVL